MLRKAWLRIVKIVTMPDDVMGVSPDSDERLAQKEPVLTR